MDKETSTSILATAWKVLYGEDYESIPDPNKDENIPYMKAKKKEKADAFKRLMKGQGKVLFEQWKDRIKKTNLMLLFIPKNELCNCPACMSIREVRSILELWVDAEQMLMEDK